MLWNIRDIATPWQVLMCMQIFHFSTIQTSQRDYVTLAWVVLLYKLISHNGSYDVYASLKPSCIQRNSSSEEREGIIIIYSVQDSPTKQYTIHVYHTVAHPQIAICIGELHIDNQVERKSKWSHE